MKRLLLGLVLATASCADYEDYTQRLPGVPLMLGEFQSYASEADTRYALSQWPIVEGDRPAPDNGGRPPFVVFDLTVHNYSHLGETGELRVSIFNDRLQSVVFYPDSLERYLSALKARGVILPSDLRAGRVGNTIAWTDRDHQGRDYVSWADARLFDQSARWIGRYS